MKVSRRSRFYPFAFILPPSSFLLVSAKESLNIRVL